jgi:hypothetical protein
VFHFGRIGLALDNFFDYETGSFEIALDRWRREEIEIHGDGAAPQCVGLQSFVADVKGEQQQSIRLENARHLAKDLGQSLPGKIDDGIEGGNAGQRRIGKRNA